MSIAERIKKNLEDLPLLSEASRIAFGSSYPRLLALVEERLSQEDGDQPGRIEPGVISLLRDLYVRFGETLKAVYTFHLYGYLADEAAWVVSVLRSRGLEETWAERLISAWTMAIHGLIKPPEADELARALVLIGRALSALEAEPFDSTEKIPAEAQTLAGLAYQGRRRESAELVLSSFELGFTPERICDALLFPALRYIGFLWQKNAISAAEEHIATEILRYSVFRLFDGLPKARPLDHKGLLACVPGDEHELGLEIMAEFLRAKGWTAVFIGRSAPAEDILSAASASNPQVVFLSVSLLAHLPEARQMVSQIRSRLPRTQIILAGPAAGIAALVFGNEEVSVASSLEEGYHLALERIGRHA
jgi:methanogenic corrinoid protein MtbC1